MFGVIYKVLNTANGNFYIGQTRMKLRQRWLKHTSDAKVGQGWVLAKAIRKYGVAAFTLHVLEECATLEDMNTAEIRWIAELKPEYNACAGGGGIKSASPEVRAKLSAASKGKPKSPEHRAKMRAACIGRVASPETRKKIAAAQRGKHRGNKHGAANGAPITAEDRAAEKLRRKLRRAPYASPLREHYEAVGAKTKNEKIRASQILRHARRPGELAGPKNPMFGNTMPAHLKARYSVEFAGEGNPFFGKLHSEETRAKMRAAHAARPPVMCPHCSLVGQLNTMKRWHFDNCGYKA